MGCSASKAPSLSEPEPCKLCGVEIGHLNVLNHADHAWEELSEAAKDGCMACSIIQEAVRLRCGLESTQPSPDDFDLWTLRLEFAVADSAALDLLITTYGQSSWWKSMRLAHFSNTASWQTSICPTLTKWIEECDRDHEHKPRQVPELPTRVLDLGVFPEAVSPRLIKSGGRRAEYVTLSHCWGSTQLIKTTRQNMSQYLNGVDFNELSQTFRDAIIATRDLGIRYLWIDSLCIVQDDKIDWENESSRMGEVYSNSYLTLAATGSENGAGGLFQLYPMVAEVDEIRKNCHGIPVTIQFRQRIQHRALETKLWGDEIWMDPLSRRAWAYQERLLARRIVHFTRDELVWECQTCRRCECSRTDIQGPDENPAGTRLRFYRSLQLLRQQDSSTDPTGQGLHAAKSGDDYWNNNLVPQYSIRQLTVHEDRLPAFSGIARLIVKPGNYLAGLRKYHLVDDLRFYCRRPLSNVSAYRAPSWSWASLEGVTYHGDLGTSELVTIKDVSCVPATSDPFGTVASGYLVIVAPSAPISIVRHEPEWDLDSRFAIKARGLQLYSTKERQFFPDRDVNYTDTSRTLYIVSVNSPSTSDFIVRYFCMGFMVVEKLEDNKYRRIGWSSCRPMNGASSTYKEKVMTLVKGLETREFHII